MSGFNSVDDFYDVMAGRHGLHESEPGGGTLELYSCNGAEFPDGLDGCSLDVITAPSPEFLAYMRGNDSPVPPPGYKDDDMLDGADRAAVFEAWRDATDAVSGDMHVDTAKLPEYVKMAKAVA